MPKLRLFCCSIFLTLLLIPAHAQQERQTISITIPTFYEETMRPVIADFMASNPDLQVEIVVLEPVFNTPGTSMNDYLDAMANVASSADVILGLGQTTPITTRAGYFLDLAPIANTDTALAVDDIYPNVWQSFQWDGGLWAIPLAFDVMSTLYNPAAFDAAGLSYPDERWTVEDVAVAAEQLLASTKQAPLRTFVDMGYLATAELNSPLFDPQQLESPPTFSDPQLAALLEQWLALQTAGYFTESRSMEDLPPLVFAPSAFTRAIAMTDEAYNLATLPGGRLEITAVGIGISAGTSQAEQAYRLVHYLSTDEAAFRAIIGQPIPARRSQLENVAPDFRLPEHVEQVVMAHLPNATPASHSHFSQYVSIAANQVLNGETDVANALLTVETTALSDLQLANERRQTAIVVTQPNSTAPADEIQLNFGVLGSFGRFLNREAWEAVLTDFAELDPQVGIIELQAMTTSANGDTSLAEIAERVDCWYQPTRVNLAQDLSPLLPIDPLLSVDSNLTVNDFAGNSVPQLSRDGLLYGLPINIQPEVLYYDKAIFEARGAPLPYQGWSIADFEQSLRSVKVHAGDPPVLDPRSFGGSYTLVLIAAYGALPLDYRTNPPGVDFTSDTSRQAIRQVLDLARDGYLQFDELTPKTIEEFAAEINNAAMYIQFLSNVYNLRIPAIENDDRRYGIVTFPQGVDFSAIAYDIGGGYISAATQYPDACYNFLVYLGTRPSLFQSMPARRSIIDSDEIRQLEGEETVAFYHAIDDLLQQPNVIEMPTAGVVDLSRVPDYWMQLWLFRAMDRYVFEDADLDAELAFAEEMTLAYQQCAAGLAPFDTDAESAQDYITRTAQCIVDVDETTRPLMVALPLD